MPANKLASEEALDGPQTPARMAQSGILRGAAEVPSCLVVYDERTIRQSSELAHEWASVSPYLWWSFLIPDTSLYPFRNLSRAAARRQPVGNCPAPAVSKKKA